MLGPGTYHVIVHGRRFIRDAEYGTVGQQMEHAEMFGSHAEAVEAAVKMKAKFGDRVTKRVAVQSVTIVEEEVP